MWISSNVATAIWQQADRTTAVDARGGDYGIQVRTRLATVKLEKVAGDVMPYATEFFVRGDEWHVGAPQDAGSYALDVVFRLVETQTLACTVVEMTLAIHTSLLDSHPMIDLCASGGTMRRVILGENNCHPEQHQAERQPAGCAAVTALNCKDPAYDIAVLLGVHDSPFTTDKSDDTTLRLRLFGDFLEKGVIRKARPWVVLGPASDEQLAALWRLQCEQKLPLTA